MAGKTFTQLVQETAREVEEIFPSDLEAELEVGDDPLLLDIRCPREFDIMHIAGSINVPRGILEAAAEYGYEETEPVLVEARHRRVIVICRSGNRSVLACHTLNQMGFKDTASLKTGLRGWNDEELPLRDTRGDAIDFEAADAYFMPDLPPEKLGPKAAPRTAA